MWNAIMLTAGLGAVAGIALAIAGRKLYVFTDPRIDEITELLPGANCGSCGFAGCNNLAGAIVEGKATPSDCLGCTAENKAKILEIIGANSDSDNKQAVRKVAYLSCNGCAENVVAKSLYHGINDCHLGARTLGAPQKCNYGCLGLGSCVRTCPFKAISIGENGLPTFDYNKCVGCGLCVAQCPQKVLQLMPENKTLQLKCNNRDKGRTAMDVCKVSCISCGLCVRTCPKQAITLTNDNNGSIPVIDYEKCIGCGLCATKCPRHCLHIQKINPLSPQEPKSSGSCVSCPLSNNCGMKNEN